MHKPFRVVLISPYGHLWALGVRQISACLKASGYETQLIFLPDPAEHFYLPYNHKQSYPAELLRQVSEACIAAGLVGISVTTNYVGRARALTDVIHERCSLPVIWGGVHPTMKPAECLTWADLVCVGEGEDAMVELVDRLARGQPVSGVPNILTRNDFPDDIRKTVRPMRQSLDDLPLPDYVLENHWIFYKNHLAPLSADVLYQWLMAKHVGGKRRITYMTYFSRGCPSRCTYCCSHAYRKIYPDWGRIRTRKVETVLTEIQRARELFPRLEYILFSDETFLSLPIRKIQDFCQGYSMKVGLPFAISSTPGSIAEPKIKALVEAGLDDVTIGIQSGSERIRKRYLRTETNEKIYRVASLIHGFTNDIPCPRYDIITDNPYETGQDKFETLEMIYRLPRPFRLAVFSLTFYPGTDMYLDAKIDGLIQDDEKDVYSKNFGKLDPNYYNFILLCFQHQAPRWLLTVLIHPVVFRRMSHPIFAPLIGLLWKVADYLRHWRTVQRFKHL